MALINELLVRDEQFRRSAYPDSLGFTTIGIGRCIDARAGGGITRDEAEYLLQHDIDARKTDLEARFSWFSGLDEVRQCVLLSMAFQLGSAGLFSFRRTLQAVEESRFGDAADYMMQSRWAQQTPLRASRLAAAMRSGDQADFRLGEDV